MERCGWCLHLPFSFSMCASEVPTEKTNEAHAKAYSAANMRRTARLSAEPCWTCDFHSSHRAWDLIWLDIGDISSDARQAMGPPAIAAIKAWWIASVSKFREMGNHLARSSQRCFCSGNALGPTLTFLIFLALKRASRLLSACSNAFACAFALRFLPCRMPQASYFHLNQQSDHGLDRHRSNVHECSMILSLAFFSNGQPCPMDRLSAIIQLVGWKIIINTHQH